MILLFLGSALESTAQQVDQPQSASAFHERLVNTTIIATSSFGNNFKEYHAPDGRVLGYNWDDVKNIRSCWRIISRDTICYYYEAHSASGEQSRTNETCWYYEWLNDNQEIKGHVIEQPHQTMHAYVRKNNPDNLSDFGVSWTCGQQIVAMKY